jgi:hypothetical protein
MPILYQPVAGRRIPPLPATLPLARPPRATRRGRAGQSLVETCLAMGMICLIFMGMIQISQLLAAKEILNYAASRATRAKTVGFNQWMVIKAARVAAIPNSGRLVEPIFENIDEGIRQAVNTRNSGELWDYALKNNGPGHQLALEQARIPDYMGADTEHIANTMLNYEGWNDGGVHAYQPAGSALDSDLIRINVWQDVPLWVPMHRTFCAADDVRLEGTSTIESHYNLYLDDEGR